MVSGASAAWLHGVDVRRAPHAPLEVTLPRNAPMGPRAGLAVRRALLPDDDIVAVGGIPVTSVLRTAFDLSRRPPLVEAVVALDAFLHVALVRTDELVDYALAHPRWRGVRQIAEVVALAEPRAESPMETRLRVLLVLAGLPRPDVQIEVYAADGTFIARLDLGYRQLRLGIEFDGDDHRDRATFVRDLRRQNALREIGWTLLRYTGADCYRYPRRIVVQVSRIVYRAA